MRLLAIDQGSHDCGIALYEDGVPVFTAKLHSPAKHLHQERMKRITTDLAFHVNVMREIDVFAIEGIVTYPKMRQDGLLLMGETRGWLKATIWQRWPMARVIDVPPQMVKTGVGAPRNREGALAVFRTIAPALALEGGWDKPMSDDECAAVCIGRAALAILEREKNLLVATG